jgi:aryl-alcohol dehydrogenase-like predicted oxidoreductase
LPGQLAAEVEEARRIVDVAVDGGITLIDTADNL